MSKFAEYFSNVEEPSVPIIGSGGSDASAEEDYVRNLSAEELLTEIPVSLEVFIRDKKYLGESTFKPSGIQAEVIHHVERIYFPELYPKMAEHDPYWDNDLRMTNYHAVQWGKGAGKDAICRMSFLRIAYLFMCLKNPQQYFGMPNDDDVHMLNIAVSAKQAQRAFFNPLKKNVARGWFNGRAHVTKDEIEFEKGLIGISGHSETESQEGLNLLLGICDEIDGFKTKAELARFNGTSVRDSNRSAESIMNMMRSSGITRFPEVFKQVYISFPRYLGSTIQMKTEEGRKDIADRGSESNWFVSGPHATWVVHPNKKESHFRDEYKNDRHEAAAKYGCDPTFAADPYFKNSMAVDAAFRHEDEPAITVSYVYNGLVWAPEYAFSESFYPIQGAQYSMHADLAVKGDRAGIAMSHVVRNEAVDKDVLAKDGSLIRVTDILPQVKVDFVIAYEADLTQDPVREIQIRWARDLWAELKLRGFNIQQVSFDGYQSTESRQELERLGIKSPIISTDRTEDPWKTLRDLFNGRIDMPYNEILRQEILGLTKRTNGKVDHTSLGSKDLADAVACSATGAIMLGGQEDPSGARAYYAKPEFIVDSKQRPELEFDSRDVFNMDDGSYDFHSVIQGDGWSGADHVSSWFDS